MQKFYTLLFTLFFLSGLSAQDDGPVGWASLGDGTTGGVGGEEVTVSTRDEFNNAVRGNESRIVIVQDTIALNLYERINVGSNKTIRGATPAAMLRFGGLQILGSNVIVQNLSIGDSYDPADPDGKEHPTDGITIFGQNVWVDHCWLYSAADGLLDVRSGNGLIADYVTISNTRFGDHNKVSLIGSSDNETESRGHLRITYYNNWFDGTYGKSVVQRIPRVRFGDVHLFNNYFEAVGSYAVAARFESDVVVERNYFRNVRNALTIEDRGLGTENADLVAIENAFELSTGRRESSGEAFVPGDFYDYTPVAAERVPAIAMNAAGTFNPADNAAPVAFSDTLDFTVSSSDTIVDVLANDTDADNDSLRIARAYGEIGGLVTVSNNRLNYVRPIFPEGKEVIRYEIVDLNGGVAQAELVVIYDATTSTERVKWADARIQLFPNPASASATLRFDPTVFSAATATVMDVHGRPVAPELVSTSAGELTVNTQSLPTGMYTVLLRTAEGTFGRRLMVAR